MTDWVEADNVFFLLPRERKSDQDCTKIKPAIDSVCADCIYALDNRSMDASLMPNPWHHDLFCSKVPLTDCPDIDEISVWLSPVSWVECQVIERDYCWELILEYRDTSTVTFHYEKCDMVWYEWNCPMFEEIAL